MELGSGKGKYVGETEVVVVSQFLPLSEVKGAGGARPACAGCPANARPHYGLIWGKDSKLLLRWNQAQTSLCLLEAQRGLVQITGLQVGARRIRQY